MADEGRKRKMQRKKGANLMKNLFKKIGALLVAAVMVLSMCTAVFAEKQETPVASKASLTVQGLVPGETTTVEVYKVVEWDAANSSWKRANDNSITEKMVDFGTDPVTINWAELAKNRENLANVKVEAKQVTTGSVTFSNLDIGAYYVYAQSGKTTYSPMGEAVYAYNTDGLMIPANKTIDAKGSTYTLTKAFKNDNKIEYKVVNRGQEVPFTITAIFPSYDKAVAKKDRAFQITDEPEGMKVTGVTVKVGDKILNENEGDYTLVSVKADGSDGDAIEKLPAAEGQKVRVRFSPDYIGEINEHAGKTVTVEVTAQITGADTFENKASSDKGSNTPEEKGKLGSITINKYDENYVEGKENNKRLAGAEFSIAPKDGTKIQFVYVGEENGVPVYTKATTEENGKVTNIVATNGVVVAKGLDDGEYTIVEEKAPAGYSVVVEGKDVTIVNGDNPAVTVDVSDTKLHSLPHTGGMGTYLFTIIGVVVMAGAAGAFFISRRKGSEE